ncbi:MAG: hypothetical protein IPO92_15525 [Saprospiraceae bacterium]|nr:hypothetical protein [Saprospiraceae bacterium]
MNMVKSRAYLFIFLLSSLSACETGGESLTPEEKYTVDTIYNNTLSVWRASIDSICNAQKDTIFQKAVDSIKKETIEEIEMMFKNQ